MSLGLVLASFATKVGTRLMVHWYSLMSSYPTDLASLSNPSSALRPWLVHVLLPHYHHRPNLL